MSEEVGSCVGKRLQSGFGFSHGLTLDGAPAPLNRGAAGRVLIVSDRPHPASAVRRSPRPLPICAPSPPAPRPSTTAPSGSRRPARYWPPTCACSGPGCWASPRPPSSACGPWRWQSRRQPTSRCRCPRCWTGWPGRGRTTSSCRSRRRPSPSPGPASGAPRGGWELVGSAAGRRTAAGRRSRHRRGGGDHSGQARRPDRQQRPRRGLGPGTRPAPAGSRQVPPSPPSPWASWPTASSSSTAPAAGSGSAAPRPRPGA